MKKTTKKKNRCEFKLIPDSNARQVLDIVYRTRGISRAELARQTGFQPSAITTTVANLLNTGFLIEDKTPQKTLDSSGGRPAKLVHINGQFRFVLAVDIEPDRLRVALTGLDLELVSYYEREMSRFDSKESIISHIIEGCEHILSINENWRKKVIGIGVNVPGEVDIQKGISIGSTNMPKWKNIPIVDILQKKFKLPVKIENSIHLTALAEKRRRPEIFDRNVLCLVLRTGIGVALLIKGVLYSGASHQDGELGHTVVDVNGSRCECGRTGCLETFISPNAIQGYANEAIDKGQCKQLLQTVGNDPQKITKEMIYQLAKDGDADCQKIVQKITHYLGLGIANLIQVLNPHELIICGSIDIAEDFFLNELNSVFDKVLLPKTRKDIKVILSPYKDKAALFGAAALIVEQLFSLPAEHFE